MFDSYVLDAKLKLELNYINYYDVWCQTFVALICQIFCYLYASNRNFIICHSKHNSIPEYFLYNDQFHASWKHHNIYLELLKVVAKKMTQIFPKMVVVQNGDESHGRIQSIKNHKITPQKN